GFDSLPGHHFNNRKWRRNPHPLRVFCCPRWPMARPARVQSTAAVSRPKSDPARRPRMRSLLRCGSLKAPPAPGPRARPYVRNRSAPVSDHVVFNAGGKSVELPILKPTLGNDCVDVSRLTRDTGLFTYDSGFTATASCKSAITYIDGDKGVLLYRGYPIEQLAEHSSFLEVAYLLMNGELPTADEFSTFEHDVTH